MEDHTCGNCAFRAIYDKNPKSLLGRIWRWHAVWCPGWNSYMKSLPEEDRVYLSAKYDMKKYS